MQINSSHNAKKILFRLRGFLKVRTDSELSKILGVQPSTISTWKKRNSLDYSLLLEICELYKIDLNSVFLENPKEINNSQDYLKTPLITKETIFEYTRGVLGDISNLPHYSIPFVHTTESRLFQITSNNMMPYLEENSYAICEKIEVDSIRDEDIIVVISREKGVYVNLLKKAGADFLLLNTNHNQAHDDKVLKINKEHINEAWKVKGKISYHLKSKEGFPDFNYRLHKLEKAFIDTAKFY